MDKRFLFPNHLDSDYKLTRASSYTELSATKKLVFEEKCKLKNSGNLIKQYSYEQIFDQKTNTSQVKISQTFKSDDEERTNTWDKIFQIPGFSKNSERLKDINSLSNSRKMSFSNQNLCIEGPDSVTPKPIIAPAKLIIKDNEFNQSNDKIQNNVFECNQKQSDNEKVSVLFSEFKKPLPTIDISEKNHLTRDEKTNDNHIVEKDDQKLVKKDDQKLIKEDDQKLVKKDLSDLKRNLRSLVPIEPQKTNRSYLCWSFLFLILLPITVLYVAAFLNSENLLKSVCDPHFTMNKIPQDLKNKLYGQDSAVNDLTQYFIDKNGQTGFDILILTGGIGVGKSYAAEIIKDNLKDSYNILEYYPPLFRKEDNAYRSLSVCSCNLVRLENLKTDDILDAVIFLKNLKKKVKNHCILILAMFNTQETDQNLKRTLDLKKSISLIDEKFQEADLQPILVSFTSMTDEALEKCIKDAAEYTGMNLSNDDIEYVKRDLLLSDSGCKGAYAKVQLVGKAVKSDL